MVITGPVWRQRCCLSNLQSQPVLPETRELRYFVAVADEGTFTAAADRLFISQQSVSAAIRQLERRLGIRLLHRDGRTVGLTAAGERFLVGARATLAAAEDTVRDARGAAERQPMQIGYTVLGASELTTPIIAELQQTRPDVDVRLRLADYDDPSAGLRRGLVDAAIVRRPIEGDYEFENLFAERRVAVLPSHHPLARRPWVTMLELAAEPVIADPGADETWRSFWMACDLRDAPPTNTVEVASFEDELAAVALGRAIAFTTEAAGRLHPRPDLAYLPLKNARPCTVALAWVPARPPDLLQDLLSAARRVRERAQTDGTFSRYGWQAVTQPVT